MCVGFDYSDNPSKAGIYIYQIACLANGNSMELLVIVSGLLLVGHAE